MKKIVCILSLIMVVCAASAANKVWTNGSGDRNYARGSNWADTTDAYVWVSGDAPIISMSGTNSPIINSNVACGAMQLAYSAGSTGEVTITGGTSTFTNCTFAAGGGTITGVGIMNVNGGTATFTGYFTIGNTGTGILNITDGVLNVNRSQLCQVAGSTGQVNISGGEFNVTRYLTIGSAGTGTVNLTGGTVNVMTEFLRLGDITAASSGILNISGTGIMNVPMGTATIGDNGYGLLNISGGGLNVMSMGIALVDEPNSIGDVYVSGGELNVATYLTVGAAGPGKMEISGGKVSANRMALGQGLIGQLYTTTGELKISGGELNLANFLEIGRDAAATFILEGDAATIKLSNVELGNLSTSKFVLNGSAGVGNGLAAFAGTQMDGVTEVINDGDILFKAGALLDADFVSGTSVAGDYVVMASAEPALYLGEGITDESQAVPLAAGDITDMLTSTAQGAGWKATLYDAGSGSAVVLTSPVTAAKAAWASAGASNVAVVDGTTVNMSSAKTANGATIGDTGTGTLNIAAGANGAFVNFTVGADAGSNGTVAMSGGTVNVASAAYIGKNGAASMDISGGSFTALNVIAGAAADSTSNITVSGNSVFTADNFLAIGSGAEFTVSGYQTTINAANLTLADGGKINFEIDQTNGAGNGIVVAGNVILDGTISVEQLGTGRVEGTYTVIRCSGKIIDNTNDLVDSAFVSYDIVENETEGTEELQLTFFTPESCEDVIENGFGLAADMNEDCKVNIEDISVLAAQWLTCNDPTLPECDWLAAN